MLFDMKWYSHTLICCWNCLKLSPYCCFISILKTAFGKTWSLVLHGFWFTLRGHYGHIDYFLSTFGLLIYTYRINVIIIRHRKWSVLRFLMQWWPYYCRYHVVLSYLTIIMAPDKHRYSGFPRLHQSLGLNAVFLVKQ